MTKELKGKLVRSLIWLSSAVVAGAMKPLLFPQGGMWYALAALSVIFSFAILGYVAEARVLKGASNSVQD